MLFLGMKELKEFYIPFSSLKLGSNSFHNKIDKSFFEAFNYSNPHDCNIDVNIDFRKEVHLMDIRINYKGITNVKCDRCLSDVELSIDGNFNSIIKLEHVDDQIIKEGVIYLPYESYQFNVAPILYEHYLLNFPKRNVHQKEMCDPDQLELVLKYTKNTNTQNHDPRWDMLKELKNKK
jgi:uncharacterized metal-binding protein YceD (DUF177 family)